MILLIQAHTPYHIILYMTLTYTFINQLVPGTLLSKIDLKDAFRLISVHQPIGTYIFGIRWKQQFYRDNCLPF